MELKRLVLNITEKEGVTVDPLIDVDNKHTGRVQQMYRWRTLTTMNDMSSILPQLTSKGKIESKKHEECEKDANELMQIFPISLQHKQADKAHGYQEEVKNKESVNNERLSCHN